MSGTRLPILYSFRRCPYAMRARIALVMSGQQCVLREVKLANKPPQMIATSPKATVPVLVLESGEVLDESLAIMHWALAQNDPEDWRKMGDGSISAALISANDGPFKNDLDRYKYHTRYADENGGAGVDPLTHRAGGLTFIKRLEAQLASNRAPPSQSQLFGRRRSFTDIAIFPFVRQFANHDRPWFNALPLPHLHDWLAGHLESDLFKTAMMKTPVWQDGDEMVIFPKLTAL